MTAILDYRQLGFDKPFKHNYTNRKALPLPYVRAAIVINEKYHRGDGVFRSVTELVNPPRLVALKRLHEGATGDAENEIVYDVADMFYAVLGNAFHKLMEEGSWGQHEVSEQRLFATVEGVTVSGAFDLMAGEHLVDYKMISCFEAQNGLKEEKIAQANLLAQLARMNGLDVKTLGILYGIRDWFKSRARFNPDYPDSQVDKERVPLWDSVTAENYLHERVRLHRSADYESSIVNGELPKCTPEERWARDECWAVHKKGAKKAVKLFKFAEYGDYQTTHNAAAAWVTNQNDAGSLELRYRPGEQVRCLDYCPVAKWCSQAKELGVKV